MRPSRSDPSDRAGRWIAKLLAVLLLAACLLGVPALFWYHDGIGAALIAFAGCVILWGTRMPRVWQQIDKPELIDSGNPWRRR